MQRGESISKSERAAATAVPLVVVLLAEKEETTRIDRKEDIKKEAKKTRTLGV